eukprot:13592-Eustigmatos_ZCMA.PRE.1
MLRRSDSAGSCDKTNPEDSGECCPLHDLLRDTSCLHLQALTFPHVSAWHMLTDERMSKI